MHRGEEDEIPAYHLVETDAGVMVNTSTKRSSLQDRDQCLTNRKDENSEIEVEDRSGSVRHGQCNSEGRPSEDKMPLGVGAPEAVREDHGVEECECGW